MVMNYKSVIVNMLQEFINTKAGLICMFSAFQMRGEKIPLCIRDCIMY